MNKSIALFLIPIFLFCSCKATQYTPANFEKAMISFGSGGGFTGAVDSYFLLQNGQFFTKPMGGEYQELPAPDKDFVTQLFINYEILGLADINIEQTGNMYQFINFKSGQNEHKIVWLAGPNSSTDKLDLFYQNLMTLISYDKE